MEGLAPCPTCGFPLRLEAMVRWTRLISLRRTECMRSRMLPPADYVTQLHLACPSCRGVLSFPLDGPIVSA